VLQAKEAGIAATFSPYNFGGTPMTGTQAGASISLTAAVQLAHVAGYTNMTWNLQVLVLQQRHYQLLLMSTCHKTID
jgi:hypothetical protein